MIRSTFRILGLLVVLGCNHSGNKSPVILEKVSLDFSQQLDWPIYLSEWNLFEQPLQELVPLSGTIPYDLNTPLFTDYASKRRFVRIPEGFSAQYKPYDVLGFPEGTILVKNFFYEGNQLQDQEEDRLIETRLLILRNSSWEALTYVWNKDQSDARLEIAGATQTVHLVRSSDENVVFDYSVPNLVQCKSCHEKKGRMTPIGPTVRQINREYDYGNGEVVNQVDKWKSLGLLEGVPTGVLPKLPVWDDPETGQLSERARAWLEINCAHCHQSDGPAKNTGLHLDTGEEDFYRLGVNKPPVAAGRGSAGLKYAIVPGSPSSSILVHRIESTDPGVMMPELGRKLTHHEGAELIRKWIKSMESAN